MSAEPLIRCRLCGEEKDVKQYPVLKSSLVYERCKPCLRRFPVEVVFLRDKGTCGLCRERVTDLRHASVDHIVPVSLWDWTANPDGPHVGGNVQLAHLRCNLLKGSLLPDEYAALREAASRARA